LKTVKIFLVIIVLATAAASVFAGGGLWGLSSWRFVSINWGLICALAALLFLSNRVTDRFIEAAEAMGRTRGFRILAVAVFLLLAYLLRADHDLWGERTAVAYSIDGGLYFLPNSPLGMLVNALFFRLCNGLLLMSASASTSLLSVIAGACYLLGGFYAAKTILGGDRGSTVSAAKIVLFGGSAALFFGAGGNEPLAILFSLLFIVSALRYARGDIPLLLPSLLFLASLLSHISSVYLFPALIYLTVECSRRKGRKREVMNTVFLVAGALIVFEFAFHVLADSPGPLGYFAGRAAGMLSGVGEIGPAAALLGALNALLLSGPAAVAALVLLIPHPGEAGPDGRGSVGAERNLLKALLVPALLLCLAAGWRIESGLRWHIVAPAFPAFAVCLLWTLRNRLPAGPVMRRALTIFAVLGIFHTAPIILANTSPAAAERRLLSLPLPSGRSETILGIRAFEHENFERAEEWLSIAAEKDQANDLSRYYLGRLHMRSDYYVKAITRFNEACEIAPDSPRYAFALAEALIAYSWYAEAIERLEQLTSAYPDSIRFWKRLGYAMNHGGMYADAIEIYGRVLLMEPSNEGNVEALVSAITNRGTELHREGDIEGARKHYERAIQLYPSGWAAQNNLAAMELDLGNTEKAYGILEKALELNPFVSKLNLNMGLVLEKMGRYEEAYDYLRKSYELDPMYSGAEPHLQRLLETVGRKETPQ
jgi:tetratricopeptide (TPR) repeat protein